jgi:hypothetical protein
MEAGQRIVARDAQDVPELFANERGIEQASLTQDQGPLSYDGQSQAPAGVDAGSSPVQPHPQTSGIGTGPLKSHGDRSRSVVRYVQSLVSTICVVPPPRARQYTARSPTPHAASGAQ